MAEDDKVQWHPPLKAPAVEIIDLSSSDESLPKTLSAENTKDNRDALNDESEDDDDDQWSMYEEALDGLDDGDNIHNSM